MAVFWKLAIFIAGLIVFQIIAYFGVEPIEGEPHNVKSRFDERIPVVPWTGVIYSTWFPLIAVAPLLLFYADFKVFRIYVIAWVIDIVISSAAYLIYPTSFERPPATSGLLKFIYKASFKQINCAPSLHCSVSYLVIFACIMAEGMHAVVLLLLILDSIGICITTLTTKQHVLIDVFSAVPFALLSWYMAIKLSSIEFICNLFGFLGF